MRKRDGDPLRFLCCGLSCPAILLSVSMIGLSEDRSLGFASSPSASVRDTFLDSLLGVQNLSMMLERDPAFLIPDTTELSLPPIEDSLGLCRMSGLLVATKEPNLVKDLDDQL